MAEDARLAELETKLAEAQASIDALQKKNKELIDEKRSTKTGAEAKVADLEAEVAELREQVKKSETTHTAAVDKLTKERDELTKSLGETSAKARDFQSGVTLREALGKVGIGKLNPEDVTDAIGFVKSMLKYNDKGEAFVAYKDGAGKEIEQPLGEYVEKVYPTTSHAKRFIPASVNSGAGGGLNLKKADGTAKSWAEMGLAERTALFKADPARANELMSAAS
jgi:hypothetical protein